MPAALSDEIACEEAACEEIDRAIAEEIDRAIAKPAVATRSTLCLPCRISPALHFALF
jgi:hypothetical protein